jgi:flagellar protein FliJ
MKRFRFDLQKLLDYRASVEEKLLAELAVIRAEYERELAKLAEIKASRHEFRDKMRRKLSKGDPDDIKQADSYLNELGLMIKAQEQVVHRCARSKEAKTNEVLEASKERKVLQKLREQKKLEHRREFERQEQKFLDDIACMRHRRSDVGCEYASGG